MNIGIYLLFGACFLLIDWIRDNVRQVVDEEISSGRQDIFYAQFDYFQDGYVANGHPSAATHDKMARQLIAAIEANQIFSEPDQPGDH